MCSSFEAICPKHAVSLHLDMCVCMCVRVGVCAFVFVYVSMTKNGSGECLCLVLKKKLYFCISVVETVWYTIVFLLSPLSPHSAVTFIYIYKCPFPACIFNKTSSIQYGFVLLPFFSRMNAVGGKNSIFVYYPKKQLFIQFRPIGYYMIF